ncbi:MAG: 2-dehydro-3-deoxy-D-gluconate 5-dehydrogenase KduD [Pseudomonadota bacterium]|nr:2-dehydro-3-deoxy-D-gluconate 5-dehydrogenase KduD [Pseudomonadota bacterium]
MTASLFDLSGKTALVTGARSGLGQAMAEALAAAGADIAGVGSSAMPDTAQKIAAAGRRFLPLAVDLASQRNFDATVERATEVLGGIDILINNAGIIRRSDFLRASDDDWDAVMAVNLRSVFALTRSVANHMVATKRAGRIVNIASLLSFQGGIRVAAYAASKHALTGLTRAAANELAPHAITVNAIAPGYMITTNTQALRDDPQRSREILSRIPVGRWGVPEDLATAVLFLASPASSYVTGAVISVDGGWLAR